MNWHQLLRDYRTMAKPRAVEEVGDIYLIRPLGFLLVQALRHTPVTPTMVSVLAVLAGWACAWFYFESGRLGMVPHLAAYGAAAMLLHSGLDSADGQLARLKQMSTPLGRIVDGFCDNLAFAAVYIAVPLAHWWRTGEFPVVVALLAAAAGASHAVQSSLVEYQRNLYLFCVHGRRDVVESQPDRLRRAAARTGVSALLQALHRDYYRRQRAILHTTAEVEQAVTRAIAGDPDAAAAIAGPYEAAYRPMLPFWAVLASNSHKLGIVLSAWIPVAPATFWSGLGMGWYFLYVLALNGAAVALVLVQRGVDRRFLPRIPALALPGRAGVV